MKMSSGDLRIVTTKTPLRITFTGGGTDLPQYYKNYGPGAVVSAAMEDFDIEIANSVIIGDRDDMEGEMGRKLGIKYIILKR